MKVIYHSVVFLAAVIFLTTFSVCMHKNCHKHNNHCFLECLCCNENKCCHCCKCTDCNNGGCDCVKNKKKCCCCCNCCEDLPGEKFSK